MEADAEFWVRLAAGGVAAAAMASVATPIAIAAARRFSFYDKPAGYKGHTAPTPYLGGAAVMVAFAAAIIIGAGNLSRTLPLIGGAAVLWVVGTIDDRRTVSPGLRVLVEFSLAVALSLMGRGWQLGAGEAVNALINGMWVLGVINAFNLFDNMDGAAGTMALVVCGATSVLGFLNGNAWAAAGCAALCGACIGFLPYNLAKPSRIFLGDGGSMPLGFVVAMLVASAARGAGPSLLSLLTGLLLIGVPALDTTLVVISRRRRGVSILTGGQDHLTHRTRTRVRTARRVALVLGATQAVISAAVILATRASSSLLVYTVLGFVVCATIAILSLEQAVERGPAARDTAVPLRIREAMAWRSNTAPLALIVLGFGAGISPLFSAYYNLGVWSSIGFVIVVLAGISIIFRPPRLTAALVLSLAGLSGIGLMSLISASWASAAEAATTEANRWLSYGALFLLLAALLRGRRHARVVLIAVGSGIAVVALVVVARMLIGDATSMFLSGRLNAPLGYINGEGCVFAMALWLALALAERREPFVAALGVSAAVVAASLTLLTQSRGGAIATGIAMLVALLALPGRTRRVFVLAVTAVAFAGAAGPLLHVYSTGQGGTLTSSTTRAAGVAVVIAALAAGAAWYLLSMARTRLEARMGTARLRRVALVAATCVVFVPVAAGLVNASSIANRVTTQWHAFVNFSEPNPAAAMSGETRLLSGAGNRYDYWRVAWDVFRAHPIAGVGAGNYSAYYYRYRRTTESIQNPHSLELQTLSELGLVGALLLLALVAGVGLGTWRLGREARMSLEARTVLVATTGALTVWLVDASGDWMHLLPGVTAVAVIAASVVCAWAGTSPEPESSGVGPAPPKPGWKVGGLVAAAVAGLTLTVAGGNLLRQGLAHRYLVEAQNALAARPAVAVNEASKSIRLDEANLDAYYVKAAGQARFDQPDAAEATLLDAAREDPQEFVTWVLLGDLEVRRHNFSAAKAFYTRAHLLDPNDPTVSQLARNPASALAGGSP